MDIQKPQFKKHFEQLLQLEFVLRERGLPEDEWIELVNRGHILFRDLRNLKELRALVQRIADKLEENL